MVSVKGIELAVSHLKFVFLSFPRHESVRSRTVSPDNIIIIYKIYIAPYTDHLTAFGSEILETCQNLRLIGCYTYTFRYLAMFSKQSTRWIKSSYTAFYEDRLIVWTGVLPKQIEILFPADKDNVVGHRTLNGITISGRSSLFIFHLT